MFTSLFWDTVFLQFFVFFIFIFYPFNFLVIFIKFSEWCLNVHDHHFFNEVIPSRNHFVMSLDDPVGLWQENTHLHNHPSALLPLRPTWQGLELCWHLSSLSGLILRLCSHGVRGKAGVTMATPVDGELELGESWAEGGRDGGDSSASQSLIIHTPSNTAFLPSCHHHRSVNLSLLSLSSRFYFKRDNKSVIRTIIFQVWFSFYFIYIFSTVQFLVSPSSPSQSVLPVFSTSCKSRNLNVRTKRNVNRSQISLITIALSSLPLTSLRWPEEDAEKSAPKPSHLFHS